MQKKALVANWVQELPAVSSLQGDESCEAISFPQDPRSGLTSLKLGDKVNQPWLGMDGDVNINDSVLEQDYSGGGVDTPQYRVKIGLHKENGRLLEVRYRYYTVTGFLFKKEALKKSFRCRAE